MATQTVAQAGLTMKRVLSQENLHPLDTVIWERREARIEDATGNTVFQQADVRVPASWSQTALNIVASKYLHGKLGTEGREKGIDELISRVVSTVRQSGEEQGHFSTPGDAEIFEAELAALLVGQYASFNSPVWFNVGCHTLESDNQAKSWHWSASAGKVIESKAGYSKPQCSACFINSVEDSMESILGLAKTEGMLFKWGSGTGTNFSAIRGSTEALSGGGTASGPLSFMRGYDAFAGVIKSGGKTRRAAKMAILDADHPDIEEFIRCKSNEEKKAQALVVAGYDGNGPDSEAYASVFYQNANNSVRVTDEFMRQVEIDGDWTLTGRVDGKPVKAVPARSLLRSIAEETWRCGDPGMQFDTTINAWHTCPQSGRINASNPCSEYMFLDDSACNLASLNLLRFVSAEGFNVALFQHAVRLLILAQDILVDTAGYPTETIAIHSHDYRPLGLGYANLGALLMSFGLAYDSPDGRDLAAAITALMGGTAYRTSAEISAVGPKLHAAILGDLGNVTSGDFPGYERNRPAFLAAIRKHRQAAENLAPASEAVTPKLREAAEQCWLEAEALGEQTGFRNAQVTVLAPTGTIGFMMDCDTTGIEPMLGVVVFKKMVGGGYLTLVNQAVPSALMRLGYSEEEIAAVREYVLANSTIEGAPGLRDDLPVFDCAFRPAKGTRSIDWSGHIDMMAAVQPFLSGAISKTVNLPSEATVADVEEAYLSAWRKGLKAVAIYRDGSKTSQPVSASAGTTAVPKTSSLPLADLSGPPAANRHRLQDERSAINHHFSIAGHEGYLTVGLYPNGQPGEIFVRMSKAGSTIAGLMECFGTVVSVGLQHGVPLKVLCDKLAHTRFEPSGWTGNEEMGYAKSIMDYLFRWMELRFLSGKQLPLFAPVAAAGVATDRGSNQAAASVSQLLHDAYEVGDSPPCTTCGALMVRNGSCYKCVNCGGTSGCS